MMSRRRAMSWAAAVAAAAVVFALVVFFADPHGNPDREFLLWVTLVFSLSVGALVQTALSPADRIGGTAGLGAVPFALGFCVVTLAVAALGFAFIVLRHPVIAACISSVAAVAMVLHRPIVEAMTKFCWGVPLFGRPGRCTLWRAGLARMQTRERNEAVSAGLSELLVLCAKQPDAGAERGGAKLPMSEGDARIDRLIRRMQELVGQGKVEETLQVIGELKICLRDRAKMSDQGV